MADQIEMSTAETPAANIFRQNFNFFGKSVPMKTFSFNTDESKNTMNGTRDVLEIKVPVEVNKTWTPFNIRMAIPKDRENTFISWPRQIVQKASDFVPSGFYYTGRGDVVQCFFCGISLKHWSRTDRVEVEHRKHSPECKFHLMHRRI